MLNLIGLKHTIPIGFYDRHLDVGDTLDIVYMPSNPKINRSNKTISKHN